MLNPTLAGCAISQAKHHGAAGTHLLIVASDPDLRLKPRWEAIVLEAALSELQLANHWYCHAERLGYHYPDEEVRT